jgi:hypothetical protein
LNSTPNKFASLHQIGKRQQLAFATNFSGYINFKKGFSASAILQYTSPVNEIQGKTYSDALYFISLEKQFAKGLKAGIQAHFRLQVILPTAGTKFPPLFSAAFPKEILRCQPYLSFSNLVTSFNQGKEEAG